jgi:hypothetical protein
MTLPTMKKSFDHNFNLRHMVSHRLCRGGITVDAEIAVTTSISQRSCYSDCSSNLAYSLNSYEKSHRYLQDDYYRLYPTMTIM